MASIILCSIIVAIPFFLVFCLVIPQKDPIDYLKIVGISFIAGFIFTGCVALNQYTDEINYNNGYCECGGQWELVDIESDRWGNGVYFYECDKCGTIIETDNFMNSAFSSNIDN